MNGTTKSPGKESTAPGADSRKKKPIGQILISQGLITQDQLRIALIEQTRNPQPLGRLMVLLGFISEGTLRQALSKTLGQESIDLSKQSPNPEALALVPRDMARKLGVFPLAFHAGEQRLTVAMVDPNNLTTLDQLNSFLSNRYNLNVLLAGESEIYTAINQSYGHELSIDGILHEIETGEVDWTSLVATSDEFSQPVVRLINAIISDAVQKEASDIHFEPENSFLRIRYRMDGLLHQVRSLHKSYWSAMVVRLKVLSSMNIAETRSAQDGRFTQSINGHLVDFRVAIQPTIHGENVVLRILDRQKGIVPLEKLGLLEDQLHQLRLMIARPEGIILVTGPTGSGKTTTLYSIINHINVEGINIMTLEDPVEYPMPWVRQTSVAEAVKMDFANGIRSMMRQDPDVILVGEIRDQSTAEMAFRAAMTGHQVYSTLHTSSALGAIPRLLDMGIKSEILSGNIVGVIAQRLVRRLCVHCRSQREADPHELLLFGKDPAEQLTLYQAGRCEHCNYYGYRGRLALMELIRLDPQLDEIISDGGSLREMKNLVASRNIVSLAQDGLRRVLDGTTTLDEVARVVDLTERM